MSTVDFFLSRNVTLFAWGVCMAGAATFMQNFPVAATLALLAYVFALLSLDSGRRMVSRGFMRVRRAFASGSEASAG